MASSRTVEAEPVPADETEPDLTITLDPHRPGRHRARLVHYGRPIWALISYLEGNDWDVVQTARDYALPEAAVRAAIDHYRSDPKYIDAFLLLLDDAHTA